MLGATEVPCQGAFLQARVISECHDINPKTDASVRVTTSTSGPVISSRPPQDSSASMAECGGNVYPLIMRFLAFALMVACGSTAASTPDVPSYPCSGPPPPGVAFVVRGTEADCAGHICMAVCAFCPVNPGPADQWIFVAGTCLDAGAR